MVTKGQVIGRIGSGPKDPHLHFALRLVIDPSDGRYWADRSSVGRALELGRQVEVECRDSVFFGPHRIPASVRLA